MYEHKYPFRIRWARLRKRFVSYFVCLGFPQTHLRATGSELIHGRKIQMDLIRELRELPARFFPSFLHTLHIFIVDQNQPKTMCQKCHKVELFGSCDPGSVLTFPYFPRAQTHWAVAPAENLFYINFPANFHGSRLTGAGNVRSDFLPLDLCPEKFCP